MDEIERRIAGIVKNRQHGATTLTMEGVRVLSYAARTLLPNEEWMPSLNRIASEVAAAKPSMAGLRNAVYRVLAQALELGPDDGRRMAGTLCEELLAELSVAADLAASNTARLLPLGTTVATCSYSSAVIRVFKIALESGKKPHALVFEPAKYKDAHGRRLAYELARLGVRTQVLDSLSIFDAKMTTQIVLIGADAVTPRFVVNGVPSLQLAQSVWNRLPFWIVCESIKLIRDVDVEVGYDAIPAEMVTSIITEDGILTSRDIQMRVEELTRPRLKENIRGGKDDNQSVYLNRNSSRQS